MGENLFEPLVNSLYETGKIAIKGVNKILGLNTLDFKKFFEEIGLCNKSKEYPKLYNIINEDYFKTYIFKVPIGISISNFEEKLDNIAFFMKVKKESIRLDHKGYEVILKVITNRPNAEYNPDINIRKDFKIPLGYDLNNNKMVLWDLISPNNCHCYIAGSSGGGKSIMLRLILSHLVNSKSKRDIEFSIVNTKRVDLKDFQYTKHTKHYMTGIKGIEDFLELEIEEMERRYILFEKSDCDDLTEFRSKHYKIPYRLIVVEEISSYKGNKDYQRSMELLASQGRGAGMILLLITQLPSHEIMPNTIKCNINTTIGLKTKDQIRAEIIAGSDSGLEKLKGNGHAKLFDGSHDGVEFQGLYISKETMKEIISKNKRVEVAGTTTTLGDNKNFGK